jgi:hypothetical protein
MSLFQLKPTVTLELNSAGAQLRDRGTDQLMQLTRAEGLLLSSLGRAMSAADVVRQVDGRSTTLDHTAALDLLIRAAAAGFLEPAVAGGAKAAAPASVEQVPCIRNDLQFSPGKRLGMVEVRDPQRNRSFTIYDFEANIARMLDGRRTLSQVHESAAVLGIDTSPEALRNFFRQLEAFGFLSAELVPMKHPRGRKTWMPEIREMFRHALRSSRRGELKQAEDYLEALLQVDPDVPEARDLLMQVKARQNGAVAPELDFLKLHGAGTPPPPPAPSPRANPFDRFSAAAPAAVPPVPPVPPLPPFDDLSHGSSPTILSPTTLLRGQPTAPIELGPFASNSLPPLWTLSTVTSAMPLPEVSDSILTFDPNAAPSNQGNAAGEPAAPAPNPSPSRASGE